LDHYEYFEHPEVVDQSKPNIQSNKQNKPTEANELKDEGESRTSDSKKNQSMIFEINNSARTNYLSEPKSVAKRKKIESVDLDNKHDDKNDLPHIDLKIHLEKVDKHTVEYRSDPKNEGINNYPQAYAEPEPIPIIKIPEQFHPPVFKRSNIVSADQNTHLLNAEPEKLLDIKDSLMHKLNGLHDKSEHIYDSLLE
jgi:hypothetical protein